jgi:hypothetical protein
MRDIVCGHGAGPREARVGHPPAARLLGPLGLLVLLIVPLAVSAQPRPAGGPPPTIEEKTARMTRIDGFFPLYFDEAAGQLWMEVARFDTDVLHSTGLATGLGSNDIGLDRGMLLGSRIVRFERAGPKVLLVQPNLTYRAGSENPAEVRAVRDAFARSVLWGFTVGAESPGRVLVDLTDFLLRDAHTMAPRLRPGTYRFEASRSSIYRPMTMGFPKNTEIEVELTFVRQAPAGPPEGGAAPGPQPSFLGGTFFEGVGAVAATAEAASLRVHHSFVELPGPGYVPRAYDPRSGYFPLSWQDYAAPLGESLTKRVIRRHRLEKVDPKARVSDPVKPIVYYLDPGTPEPIRSALLEGARWWNQAFEAAGYRNAFRVELLPEGASPLDIRYNVINWVHRSTRGWSTGGSVVDPRTGEIIKGVVTLGSLRIRQDYLIAEGLLAPYRTGTEPAPELTEWGLARIRQLAAHEVGHTLGLSHNYYDSDLGRISVMDYPHPLVTLRPDGSLDTSQVYATGIGEWDKVAIAYGYQDFPDGTDEPRALASILDEAWRRDLRFLTNQDLDAHPRVDQWSNGTNAAAELARMMAVRRAALGRFGEAAIRRGQPLALLEEALVPLYLHHRYQVEAAASVLGGQHYIYAIRGDGRTPFVRASAAEQRAALDALLATLQPAELALPSGVVALIPPRPQGYGPHRELFPRYTGPVFDAVTPAVVAAMHTVSNILEPERAARLVEQHAVEPVLPGLEEVLERLVEAVFSAPTSTAYEAEIKRAVERVVAEQLAALATRAPMPQVRALATWRLRRLGEALDAAAAQGQDPVAAAHAALLSRDIASELDRPAAPRPSLPVPAIPPGAPIGEPALDWLRRADPPCVVPDRDW